MKSTGSGIRDQGSIEQLLRRALPPVGERQGNESDLWPAMRRRLRTEGAGAPMKVRVPWFDWALAAGLIALLALFPAWIPVLLYYL